MKKTLLISLLFLTKTLFAQVPINDNCANAITLTPSTSCTVTNGTTLNATNSTIMTSCSGNSDVFYKFVANTTTATVTVVGSSGFDAVVGTYTGCGTTYLACTDFTYSGGTETVSMKGLTIGTTYFIQVQGYGSSLPTTPDFTICVQNTVYNAPANDECANAISLTPSMSCTATNGTTLNATTSTVTTSCSGNSDVFYKFVANTTTATVTVVGSSGFDAVVGTYTGCGTNYLACTDFTYSGGTETVRMTGLTIGTTYFIQVQAYGSSLPTTPDFTICVQNIIPNAPANDECVNAITLTHSTSCTVTNGTTLNATNSTIMTSCSGNSDVFYKFVANATSATVTVVGSSGFDAVVGTYTGCGTTYLACTDVTYSGGTETVSMTGLTIGTTYFIQVQAYGSSLPTTPDFTICVVSTTVNGTAPINDNCANAVVLTPSAGCVNTTGTFNNATNSGVTNSCTGYSDVFYKFVANSSTATITSAPGTGVDVVLSVMPSCSSATSLACVDDPTTPTATEVANLTGLTAGNTYYIKIQSYTSTLAATATFTVCAQSTVTTGVYETNALKSISMFPNPAALALNIENISEVTKVEFVDVTGVSLWVKEISVNSSLDISSLSAGVYIVKLTINGVTENRRLVVSK